MFDYHVLGRASFESMLADRTDTRPSSSREYLALLQLEIEVCIRCKKYLTQMRIQFEDFKMGRSNAGR